MEKVKIKEKDYEIAEIREESSNVLKITFSEDIPKEYGDIQLYTAGGIECASFPGFSTVYRRDGKAIWLSDDGNVYKEPETTPGTGGGELPMLTLDEVKRGKLSEVNYACRRIIETGVDVGLSDGTVEHFSLTETDQLNLFGLRAQIAAGADSVPYHADGKSCRFYSAADMDKIIGAAMKHASYHTTYCNALHVWVGACGTAEEVSGITYGAEVPEAYRSEVLKAYLKELGA